MKYYTIVMNEKEAGALHAILQWFGDKKIKDQEEVLERDLIVAADRFRYRLTIICYSEEKDT